MSKLCFLDPVRLAKSNFEKPPLMLRAYRQSLARYYISWLLPFEKKKKVATDLVRTAPRIEPHKTKTNK